MDTVIAGLAQYGFVLSFLIAFVVWVRLPHRQKLELLLAGLVGGIVVYALIKIGGALYYDPRPFVTEHVAPLFPHAADNGFPSDHTAVTMLVALCVLVVSRRWGVVLIAVSLLAGAARVLAHVHTPLDILAAVLMAGIGAAVGWLVTRWAFAHLPQLADR